MKQIRWQIALTISLYVILITLMVASKKSLCTDSMVVEKIDRVLIDKTETLYSCKSKVKVPYSAKLDIYKGQIERRLDNLGLFLASFDTDLKPLQLTIDEVNPIAFKVDKRNLRIGTTLLLSEGHLERGLIKSWLSTKISSKFENTLFIEVAADFILYSYQGHLDIEDPLLQMKTKLGTSRWPQVLKSHHGYCDSPWKLSEHYVECEAMVNEKLSAEGILNSSLRPLLTSVWIKTFQELSFNDRYFFLANFPKYLKSQALTSEKSIGLILTEQHPLKYGMMSIKNMTDILNSSPLILENSEYRKFYSRLAGNLQQAGVNDSFAEAYFDYVVELPDGIDTKSELFKNAVAAAESHSEFQIAIKDQSQIWILPSKYSLPLKTFDQIRAQQWVFFACPSLKNIDMNRFFHQAEKFLLVKGCDQERTIDLESLVSGGAQSFSRQNKNLAFIQFHLPSFEMKAKELAHVTNFFELVKNRDVTKSEFQTLGWRQVQWYEDTQAYKPQAIIDAIELFRTDIN